VIAVRVKDLGSALERLDPESRALLELSVRRGLPDDEIASTLRVDAAEVGRRRDELLERLAGELHLDGREQRDELFATLPDMRDRYWQR
jgi:DNA-directed RNA polymerase specialized sigma24 family protein